jgi:hypothetical protein
LPEPVGQRQIIGVDGAVKREVAPAEFGHPPALLNQAVPFQLDAEQEPLVGRLCEMSRRRRRTSCWLPETMDVDIRATCG